MDASLAQALGDIQRSLGNIEGKLDGHVDAFNKHIEMDLKAYKAIGDLQQAHARQRGFLSAVGVMGSGLGALCGWLVERIVSGHGSAH